MSVNRQSDQAPNSIRAVAHPPEDAGMWTGKASIQPGWALFAGTAGDHALHRHHAVQVALSLDAAVQVQTGAGEVIRAPGVVIPADYPHQLANRPTPLLLLYVERESRLGRRLDQWCDASPQRLSKDQCHRLTGLLSTASEATLERAVSELTDPAAAPTSHAPFSDSRIADSLAALPRPLPESLSGMELARIAGLSPSRYAHLFRQHTGMPLRPYLRWLRLQQALAEIANGLNLTQAAYASGFSDSAHLSRNFRRTFGIAPQVLLHPRLSLQSGA